MPPQNLFIANACQLTRDVAIELLGHVPIVETCELSKTMASQIDVTVSADAFNSARAATKLVTICINDEGWGNVEGADDDDDDDDDVEEEGKLPTAGVTTQVDKDFVKISDQTCIKR